MYLLDEDDMRGADSEMPTLDESRTPVGELTLLSVGVSGLERGGGRGEGGVRSLLWVRGYGLNKVSAGISKR